ncbi:hypothetical protein SADUNF_Sadunf11G0058600 [Salix dunnii]|uniref:Uncharacterized protein n=1 Tax=Salix dunnii TaxID=1413687 RepID=A0A835JNC3_9ROSI|nr:hypothetical protein SADUNF_Sadunf11G0058600 [Salix dunnii]
MGIVDGSETSPPQFTSSENKTQGILNSGYVVWQYKDQTILGWIISSLSPAVVSTIYGLETSRLAWQALGARFAAPSTSRISLIKRKLQSLQQGSMQCQQFLDAVKSLADELSAVGKPIDDSNLILSILNGLNSSFHSFVTTYMLLAKEKSMSFSDFHAELLNFDLMQKFHSQTLQQEMGSYAFCSHKPGSKTGFRHNNKTRFSGSSKVSSPALSQFRQPLPHLPSSSSTVPVVILQQIWLLWLLRLILLTSIKINGMRIVVPTFMSPQILPILQLLNRTLNPLVLPFSSPPFNFFPVSSSPIVSPASICHDNTISSIPDPPSPASLIHVPVLSTGHQESSINHPTSHTHLPPVSNSSHETTFSDPVVTNRTLSHPSSCIITRSQTGHSKPHSFPDFQLHYTTRHPLQALHAGIYIRLDVSSRAGLQTRAVLSIRVLDADPTLTNHENGLTNIFMEK